jgi:uncharacterized protein
VSPKVAVLCGDRYHSAETVRDGLTSLIGQGYVFDWVEDASLWSADRMAEYPIVVLSKANNTSATDPAAWMTEAMQSTFLDYVRQGNGLLVLHSGTAGYTETLAMRALIGGVFVEHPPQCAVTVDPVPDRALCSEVEPFTLPDEHYMMAFDDAHAEVFLHTRSEHGVQPAGWMRTEGSGRVCVLTPGHNLDVWLHPSFQTLLANALSWAGGM